MATGVTDPKGDIHECLTCGYKTNPPTPARCPACRFRGRWRLWRKGLSGK